MPVVLLTISRKSYAIYTLKRPMHLNISYHMYVFILRTTTSIASQQNIIHVLQLNSTICHVSVPPRS